MELEHLKDFSMTSDNHVTTILLILVDNSGSDHGRLDPASAVI